MRTVSLDRLAERVKLATIGYEGALAEFHKALDAARGNGTPKQGKRRGRPKGSKNKSKKTHALSQLSAPGLVVRVKKSKHPWRAKKILGEKPSNPATEATE